MFLSRSSFICLTGLATLLLSSCVEWHIGLNIRDAAELRTGLDARYPVDGELYVSRQPLPKEAELWWCLVHLVPPSSKEILYARLPEMEYKERHCYVVEGYTPWGDWHSGHERSDERLTGKSRWVAVKKQSVYLLPDDFQLPDDARRIQIPRENLEKESVFSLAVHRNMGARIAAAPFDYCLDYVLSFASSSVVWVVTPVYGLIAWPAYGAARQLQNAPDTESLPHEGERGNGHKH